MIRKILIVLMVCAALALALSACSNDSDSSSGYIPSPTPTPTPTPEPTPTPTPTPTYSSHAITVSQGVNGTVSSDKTSAKKGDNVTLTVTPNEGYEFVGVSVAGADSLNVKVNLSDGKYTFEMPDKDVTVTAYFRSVFIRGRWPQTIKAASVTVDENVTEVHGAFTYCKGSDGEWYVKRAENAHGADYKYSDGTTVGQGGTSEKWFKVEPIKWRVLTTNYGGKKLLLAGKILDVCGFYDNAKDRTIDGKAVQANNYMHSRIRACMNGLAYNKDGTESDEFVGKGFLQTAFSSGEQDSILTVTVDNSADSTTDATGNVAKFTEYVCPNTEDKLFLLSLKEVTTSEYGFSPYGVSAAYNSRILKNSDYAKASGSVEFETSSEGSGGRWWLRSPYASSVSAAKYCHSINNLGKAANTIINDNSFKSVGLVPAFVLN